MGKHILEYDWVQKGRILNTCLMVEKKGYNAIIAMNNYCIVGYGIQASQYQYKYIFETPYTTMLHGCGELVSPPSGCDFVQLNWLANIMCEFMWSGIPFTSLVGELSPENIMKRFRPLHESPIYAGCAKLAEHAGLSYSPSGRPTYK